MDRDRNLLFGLLAVQLKGLPAAQMVETAAAWATDPKVPLAQRLVDKGLLTEKDREMIEGLVEEAVRAHGGDAAATLSAFGGDEQVRKTLYAGYDTSELDAMKTAPMTDVVFFSREGKLISGVEESPGRYTLISQHARGGMGRVLLVHDEYIGRHIALKELLPVSPEAESAQKPTPVRQTASMVARFLQEARITGQLEHPSIVPVYELGRRQDGTLYYTMKLVRGKTLSQAIKDRPTLRERLELLTCFGDLCQAIAYAHSRGVIHRDLKPGNVMVGQFGETVVLDWGLAKLREGEDVHREEIEYTLHYLELEDQDGMPKTAYGRALGTPNYMPPEQAEGLVDQIDERSDVYSLGAVLYEILTGATPYSGKSTREILDKVIGEQPVPVLQAAKDVPPELATICEKALRKERSERYASAGELAEDIQRFITGSMVSAYQYSFVEIMSRYYRRHRALVNTFLGCVAALLAIGVYSYISIVQARNREHEQRLVAEDAQKKEAAARAEAERAGYLTSLSLTHQYIAGHDHGMANKTLTDTPVALRGPEWGFLLDRANPELKTVLTPGVRICGLTVSPDGTLVAAITDPGPVKIYDLATGELKASCEGGALALAYIVAFSPDGTKLVGPGQDGTVRIWETASGKQLHKLNSHSDMVQTAEFSPDGSEVMSASADGTAQIWDAASGASRARVEAGMGPLANAAFSPEGKLLIVSSADGRTKVYDRAGPVQRCEFPGNGAVFAASGSVVATWLGGAISFWDPQTGLLVRELKMASPVLKFRLNSAGDKLLAVYEDFSARLWDVNTGELIGSFLHEAALRDAGFAGKDSLVVTCGDRNTFAVWDVKNGYTLNQMSGRGIQLYHVAFSPDGSRMLSTANEEFFQVWDPLYQTGRRLLDFKQRSYPQIAVAEKGNQVATLDHENGVRVFSINGKGRPIHLTSNWPAIWGGAGIHLSPDGTRLAVAIDANLPSVWDLASNQFVQLVGHRASVSRLSFSPDGKRIATASDDMTARVWDTESGRTISVLEGHTDRVWDAKFSPDAQQVLTCSADGTAALWDAESGKRFLELKGHTGPVSVGAFSIEGKRAFTGSEDRTVRVWETATGAEVGQLNGLGGGVYEVSVSPDGRYVVTGSNEIARIWDARSLDLLAAWPGADLAQYLLDPPSLILTFKDGRIERWEVPSWDQVGSAEEAITAFRNKDYADARERLTPETTPERVTSLVSTPTLQRALTELAGCLKTEAPGQEEQGIVLASGPRFRIARLLGLKEGDVLAQVSGRDLAPREQAVQVLEQAAASIQPEAAAKLDVTVVRGGVRVPVLVTTVKQQQISGKHAFNSEEAFRLAEALCNGAFVGLNMLQIPEVDSIRPEDRMGLNLELGTDIALLLKAGLTQFDRLTAIDNEPVLDYDNASKRLKDLKDRIGQKSVSVFSLDVMRGEFTRAHLEYTVQ